VYPENVYHEKNTRERMIWEHQELAVAIRDRDANRARAMLQMQTRRWLMSPESKEVN
jgi:DNA-binding GntR family transcriptional regulator